jgi:phage anti-repressor protein
LGKASEIEGRPTIEYLFTIDAARERQIRKYFIECEKRLRANNGTISTKDAEKLKLQAKYIEIMDRNAQSRQAQLLKSTAEFFKDLLPDIMVMVINW